MKTITAEDVETAVKEHQIKVWKLRECGFCGWPLCYFFQDGKVFFDPNCNCVNYQTPLQERTYESVAECFNIQSKPEIADRMWKDFLNSDSASAA